MVYWTLWSSLSCILRRSAAGLIGVAWLMLSGPTAGQVPSLDKLKVEELRNLTVLSVRHSNVTGTSFGPGRELLVEVNGLDAYAGAEPKRDLNFDLFVDGRLVRFAQASLLPGEGVLRFQLQRDEQAAGAWRDLVRSVRWRPVTVSIGFSGVGQSGSLVRDFRLLSGVAVIAWAGVVISASLGLLVIGRRTNLLRDGLPTFAGPSPYSVERTQVTFICYGVLAAYLFLWLVTGDTQPLNADALILLGIVFGTFILASLFQSRSLGPDAMPVHRRAVSQGFWSDIVSDAGGVSLVHVLVVGWTLLLTSVLGLAVYNDLAIPPVSPALLATTALVNGMYLTTRLGLFGGHPARPARTVPTLALEGVETFDLPPPEVPEELVRALSDGHCVLYAGAGVSATAGLPTWQPFVEGLVMWAQDEGLIDATFASALEQSISRGGVDRAADSVVSAAIERQALDLLHGYLGRVFGAAGELPQVHHLIRRLPFSAALTTNFDNLIDRAFERSWPGTTRVLDDIEALRSEFSSNRFFVLKLYGDLTKPDSMLISPAQYVERIRGDKPFLDFVAQVFRSRSLLFIGSSVAGIEAYLSPLGIRPPGRATHFALIAVTDAGWRADADLLERRYGIRVLPYRASPEHAQLPAFLNGLVQRLKSQPPQAASGTPRGSEPSKDPAIVLDSIELHNIGPFKRLELPFTRRWTVLLGDNGVGKSSVLRAIGTVVAGDVASELGGRLLKSQEKEGSISVTSRGQRFGAQVGVDSLGKPRAVSDSASCLGGSILVLSFPAIRTMAMGAGRGPELKELNVAPSAFDVLPGLDSLPDPRILGFKQWLINLDYAKRRDPALAPRVDAIIGALMGALQTLLGGLKLGPLEIDEKNVFVNTGDGRLPLDSLSQGTVSLLGWVGVLVQRLNEFSSTSASGTLVLVDEIDAHMHPEWQQAIIKRLSDAFPDVQFIVSSHSPFLAVGREAGEIVRFRRDPLTRQVTAEPTDRDTKGMTVADVLTSYLFGLQTPVDPDLERKVLRMRQLSVKPELTDPELSELRNLQTQLGHVGIAATQADPMYGRFIQEMRLQGQERLAALPPMSKEAHARQREITERVLRKRLGDAPDSGKEDPQ